MRPWRKLARRACMAGNFRDDGCRGKEMVLKTQMAAAVV